MLWLVFQNAAQRLRRFCVARNKAYAGRAMDLNMERYPRLPVGYLLHFSLKGCKITMRIVFKKHSLILNVDPNRGKRHENKSKRTTVL